MGIEEQAKRASQELTIRLRLSRVFCLLTEPRREVGIEGLDCRVCLLHPARHQGKAGGGTHNLICLNHVAIDLAFLARRRGGEIRGVSPRQD